MTNNQNMIVIISSPSGAGKTSICKKLLESDKNLRISVSDTTRIPRDNEIDGTHYNFISKDKFLLKIKNNEYVEYAMVFGNYYGSLHSNVLSLLDSGFDVLFDIDWQGAKQLFFYYTAFKRDHFSEIGFKSRSIWR